PKDNLERARYERGRFQGSELAGQQTSLSQRETTVRESQSLLRHDRFRSLIAAVRVRSVEDLQQRHLTVGILMEVETSSINVLALLHIDLWAAHREIQLAGHVEDAIPDDLALHTPWIHPPQKLVVRIGRCLAALRFRRSGTRAVDTARHDHAMERFHAPS